MRVKPHHHACADCGAKTECPGTWEENYDGEPEVICPEFHLVGGTTNGDFTCQACEWKREDHTEPDEPDGEAFRGGEAAAVQRDQMIDAQRMK